MFMVAYVELSIICNHSYDCNVEGTISSIELFPFLNSSFRIVSTTNYSELLFVNYYDSLCE